MFVSKWFISEAAVAFPALAFLLAVGFASIVVYYFKWLGILLTSSTGPRRPLRKDISNRAYQWELAALSAGAVAVSALIGPITNYLVAPFVAREFHLPGLTSSLSLFTAEGEVQAFLILFLVALVVLAFRLLRRPRGRVTVAYGGGGGGKLPGRRSISPVGRMGQPGYAHRERGGHRAYRHALDRPNGPGGAVMVLLAIAIFIIGPLLVGLSMGLDRRITARLQNRRGPPLLQPFYDIAKLFSKRPLVLGDLQGMFAVFCLAFQAAAFGLFALGGDLVVAFFISSMGAVFLVLGAYSTPSPYSHLGANRELLALLAYEPVLFLVIIAVGVNGSFLAGEVSRRPPWPHSPGPPGPRAGTCHPAGEIPIRHPRGPSGTGYRTLCGVLRPLPCGAGTW